MEKRGCFAILALITIFLSFGLVSSINTNCNLNVSLVNQDPYPAIPGDLLKLVFQVNGVDSTNCQDVEIRLSEGFPFTLDPSSQSSYTIKAGTYNTKDYKTYFQAPFKLRVDEQALDGENLIEVQYKSSSQEAGSYITKQFKIEVKDVRADFEAYVKDYDFSTNTITFQVLNIGKEDISAVTIEIPNQEGISLKGSNRNIIGDLDSNEDTTTDFKLVANTSKINATIYYTDSTGVRRTNQEAISFDSSYFIDSLPSTGPSFAAYVFYLVIILAVVYFVYKKFFKKKRN